MDHGVARDARRHQQPDLRFERLIRELHRAREILEDRITGVHADDFHPGIDIELHVVHRQQIAQFGAAQQPRKPCDLFGHRSLHGKRAHVVEQLQSGSHPCMAGLRKQREDRRACFVRQQDLVEPDHDLRQRLRKLPDGRMTRPGERPGNRSGETDGRLQLPCQPRIVPFHLEQDGHVLLERRLRGQFGCCPAKAKHQPGRVQRVTPVAGVSHEQGIAGERGELIERGRRGVLP
ncbi:hypothetical protein [Caballeronia sp. LZ034LL]|uniref:hypothetical protein n=1 Tax=Caballeronia sp. LZ034LL TaxID=3038567 RepID=UPI00286C7C50|nr:hypothetical protein [Caballeronia sp. LZ034LL]